MKTTMCALLALFAFIGCGPVAGPEQRCEDEGGEWVCDGVIHPDGGEHCFCDTSQAK